MTDIVSRLRHWSHGLTYDPAIGMMHEAAYEIERLRGDAEVSRLRLDAAHADIEQLRQFDRSQPITHAEDAPDTNATPAEGSVQERCTLTDEEREAIEVAAEAYADDHGERFAGILRNLLERMT